MSFRGGKYGTSGCEFLRSASVENSQQGCTVLFSQSQERRKQRKNQVRVVGLEISSVLVGKDAENAKPVAVSTPYAVASADAAAAVVEPSAPPPDAVPKPGEVPQELLYVMPGSLQYEAGYLGGISEKTRSGETAAAATGLSPISYLTRILASKVYDVAIETPLELAPKLSEKIGAQIHLKREDMQPASTIFLHYLSRNLLLS